MNLVRVLLRFMDSFSAEGRTVQVCEELMERMWVPYFHCGSRTSEVVQLGEFRCIEDEKWRLYLWRGLNRPNIPRSLTLSYDGMWLGECGCTTEIKPVEGTGRVGLALHRLYVVANSQQST